MKPFGPSDIQKIKIILGIGIVCLIGLFIILFLNQRDLFMCKNREGLDCGELENEYNNCYNKYNGYIKKCEIEKINWDNCAKKNKNSCEEIKKETDKIAYDYKQAVQKYSVNKCDIKG